MREISEGLTAWFHVLFLDAFYEWEDHNKEKPSDKAHFHTPLNSLDALFALHLVANVLLEAVLFLQLLPQLRIALHRSLTTLFLRHSSSPHIISSRL